MSNTISTSAPGKIILFGELAVVFNRTGISGAVDLRTFVNIKESNKGEIYSSKYRKLWKYNLNEINNIRKKYDNIILNQQYYKLKNYQISHPIKYLLSKIFDDIGYKNLKISIDTKVPIFIPWFS